MLQISVPFLQFSICKLSFIDVSLQLIDFKLQNIIFIFLCFQLTEKLLVHLYDFVFFLYDFEASDAGHIRFGVLFRNNTKNRLFKRHNVRKRFTALLLLQRQQLFQHFVTLSLSFQLKLQLFQTQQFFLLLLNPRLQFLHFLQQCQRRPINLRQSILFFGSKQSLLRFDLIQFLYLGLRVSIIFQRLCKPILLDLSGLSRRGLLAKIVQLFVLNGLVFIAGDLTAFRFCDLQGEAYIHFKGLILTRALRNLKDLQPLFAIIGKGRPDCLFVAILSDYINDESELNPPLFTFGKLSQECLSACRVRWVSISMLRSLEGLNYVATC